MGVDDHAIDALRVWFDLAYEELKNEWTSGKYENFSDCPSYKGATAYREAMNILIKACYLPQYYEGNKIPTLKQTIEEELEVENFWKEREKQ